MNSVFMNQQIPANPQPQDYYKQAQWWGSQGPHRGSYTFGTSMHPGTAITNEEMINQGYLQDMFFTGRQAITSDVASLQHRVNKVFPDSFKGVALHHVESLIIVMIMQSGRRILDWLPLAYNPHGNAIHFKRTKFDLHDLDFIPEQGVGRVLTQSYQAWTETLERRGLAFQMEDGFFMTEQGALLLLCACVGLTHGCFARDAQVNATTGATCRRSPIPPSLRDALTLSWPC
jgi:hypothetical protein